MLRLGIAVRLESSDLAQAQQQSTNARCADLRSAFEAQIAVLRKSVTSAAQNAAHDERRRQDANMALLQRALAISIGDAVWNSMPTTVTKMCSQTEVLQDAETLIRELVAALTSGDTNLPAATIADQPCHELAAVQDRMKSSTAVQDCILRLQKRLHATWSQALDRGPADSIQQAPVANTTVCTITTSRSIVLLGFNRAEVLTVCLNLHADATRHRPLL